MASESTQTVKCAFFDAKSYDRISFKQAIEKMNLGIKIDIQFIEPRLTTQTVQYAQGCDAVIGFVNDDFGADVIASLDAMGIGLITMRCAGFDRVDLHMCQELGISVTRVPAYSPYAVAEFAVSLLMTLNRKTHKAYNRVRDSNFTLSGLVGMDIHGKTVGVLGTGKIGQCFIDIMIGFGCKILCYDVFVNETYAAKKEVTYTTLDDIFANSDIISMHLPLLADTKHIINRTNINKMKTGVILVNTSRGGLVDTKALIEGLMVGRIGGAGLDVYENEAAYFYRDCSDEDIEDELLARLQNMRNVIIASHQAFLTQEALDAISSTTLKNLNEYFSEDKKMEKMTNYIPAPPKPALVRALSRRASEASEKGGRRGSNVSIEASKN